MRRSIPAPTPRLNLSSAAGVRREMTRVYRDARTGRIDSKDAARLVFVLDRIGKLITAEDLEKRVESLETMTESERAERIQAILEDARMRQQQATVMVPSQTHADTWEAAPK